MNIKNFIRLHCSFSQCRSKESKEWWNYISVLDVVLEVRMIRFSVKYFLFQSVFSNFLLAPGDYYSFRKLRRIEISLSQ